MTNFNMMDWLHSFLSFCSILLLISVGFSTFSPKWDYRVKITWTYIYLFLSGFVVIPYGLIVRDAMKCALFWARIIRPISKVLNLQWEIVGQENIDRKRPYVVVCNHQSAIDVLATTHVRIYEIPEITIITKKSSNC